MSRNHPSASATAKSASVGGLVQGTNQIAVIGCSSGAIPTFTPRFYQGAAALVADAGYGDAIEFQAGYYEDSVSSFNPNGLSTCYCRVPVTTAGAIQFQSHDGVLGTSSVVASGTPLQRVDSFQWRVVNPGAVGTDGITFQYSFGGRDWSQVQRLGTATTWAVPNLGVTLTLTNTMTLLAGDLFLMRTSGPRASNADISSGLAALLALSEGFRCILIVGDYAEADMVALENDINTWYAPTGNKRAIFFVSARDSAQLATLTGASAAAPVFAASGHTITRSAGSWIADGFTLNDDVIVAGSSSNNGNLGKPTSITSTVITFSAGVVNETPSPSTLSITGVESMSEWANALLADAASFQDIDGRVAWGVGQAWAESAVRPGFRMRFPFVWAALGRYMQHDLQISPNQKSNGPLTRWQITDDHGQIVEHDSRTLQILESRGFLCATSFNREDGCFVGFPSTFGPDGSSLSIIPWRAVANAACDIIQTSTENFIGDDPDLNDDGTLTPEELELYTNKVTSELGAELLAAKAEGPRASSITWAPSATDVFNVPNALMGAESDLRTRGLINNINTTVFVNRPG
jgi:hypothetical protein